MDITQIKAGLVAGELFLLDDKIYSKDEWTELEHLREMEELYDLLQLTKKIAMNSMYGALLNLAFRFSRKELGASVTGSGRQITNHMMATISEFFTGVYSELIKTVEVDDDGKIQNIYRAEEISPVVYGDTDSVDKNSVINTSLGEMSIEETFNTLPIKTVEGQKQYASGDGLCSDTFVNNEIVSKPVKAIYRHKVSKARWKISTSDGRSVIVTDDHSIMVLRDGKLIEVKPSSINRDTDICISIRK